MRINTNILSLSAQRSLAQTTKAIARAMERLASGKRINSSRDDAAGLAISTRLEAHQRGLYQVIRNLNDSTAFLQSAEGVLSVQNDILQRMKELSIQAANGTLSTSDRTYLNAELQELKEELDRISRDASFNGRPLMGSTFNIQVGNLAGDTIRIETDSSRTSDLLQATYELDEPIGAGTFTFSSTTTAGSGTSRIASGDFNEDGYSDTAATTTISGGLYLTFGSSTSVLTTSTLSGVRTDRVTVGDVNNDGHEDLIAGGHSGSGIFGVSVWLGNGDGTFQSRKSMDSVGQFAPGAVELLDINNDSNLDLMYLERSNSVMGIYLGNGNGTFSFSSTVTTGSTPSGMDSADLNNDGNMDLVVSSSGGNNGLSIFLGNGNGTFQTRSTLATTNSTAGIVLTDINEDSELDIIATSQSGYMQTYLGNGNGTFQSVKTTGLTLQEDIDIADLNADGHIDFVTQSGSDVSIGLGNGDGTFTTPATIAITGALGITIHDFNGDGLDDFSVVSSTVVTHYTGDATYELDLDEDDLNILTAEDAYRTMSLVDAAIESISEHRARIGAYQSRIEHALSATQMTLEPISSSLSQIRDADYAEEMAEFTRLQILQQAGASVLAQANSNARLLLDLLKESLR